MGTKKTDYITKAKSLSTDQKERVLSRMNGKLPKRFLKDKVTELEALAIQLELEEEQLHEWKEKVAALREKDKS